MIINYIYDFIKNHNNYCYRQKEFIDIGVDMIIIIVCGIKYEILFREVFIKSFRRVPPLLCRKNNNHKNKKSSLYLKKT